MSPNIYSTCSTYMTSVKDTTLVLFQERNERNPLVTVPVSLLQFVLALGVSVEKS